MSRDLPLTIGAALTVPDLPDHIDWLRERNRDLEIQDFWRPQMLMGDWMPRVEEARRTLDGWGGRLGIHGPFAGFSLASDDPDIQEVIRRRLDTALDVCHAIGASQMVVHSPVTTWDHFNRDNWPGGRDRRFEAFRTNLTPALDRAGGMGVTFVLENIEDFDPRERKDMVTALGAPNLRLSIDTGHAHYAHVSTGGAPVDYFVEAAGDMLHHVHLQDADGNADRHWPPGDGSVPWPAVFRALARLSSDPRLVLELRDPGWIRQGTAWLVERGLAQ